jgi:hypothetical protein
MGNSPAAGRLAECFAPYVLVCGKRRFKETLARNTLKVLR